MFELDGKFARHGDLFRIIHGNYFYLAECLDENGGFQTRLQQKRPSSIILTQTGDFVILISGIKGNYYQFFHVNSTQKIVVPRAALELLKGC
jgi:hypothetical protein